MSSLGRHIKVPCYKDDHSSAGRVEKGKGDYPQSGDPPGLSVLYNTSG